MADEQEIQDGFLVKSIGKQLRELRQQSGFTVTSLAKSSNVSSPMISKIENGLTSPSLTTLHLLANALNVSISKLFHQYEQYSSLSLVKKGTGLVIERRGSKAGHKYSLLGHGVHRDVIVEPYMVTLTEDSEIFNSFQHKGVEFIYLLSGGMSYRHGSKVYKIEQGDSLFFDATIPHGPERVTDCPVKLLVVISQNNS